MAAAALVHEVVRRSPRLSGRAHSRWTQAAVGRVVPWLHGRSPGTIHRVLRRLGVRYKRGRVYLHSPDPAYDAKLRAVTGAQVLARAYPDRAVLLYEDELTYHRRPTVARDWAPIGTDAPRAAAGLTTNKTRRVAACLDATSGRLLVWQRPRFDVPTLSRFYRHVRAAYPRATVIFLAQDNWPVHAHPAVCTVLAELGIVRLPLPTYAPWTDPVEDLWHGLYAQVLHHHPFGDDWSGLQRAVDTWLRLLADEPARVLHLAGLPT